jgi:hypothetical protein
MTSVADVENALRTILTAPEEARHAALARLGGLGGLGSDVEVSEDGRKLLTVPKYAELCGVDDRTVWRWIKKGRVEVYRNPGGGNTFVVVPPDECRKLP